MFVDGIDIVYFFCVVAAISLLMAWRQSKSGYSFWRAFFLSAMAVTGLGLIVVKMVSG